MIFPPILVPGDKIAIISPASVVKAEYVEGGKYFFENEGFDVIVSQHALGETDGSYAATHEARLTDLLAALEDPEIRAIVCSRGGYGCIHLLPHIPADAMLHFPKWIIGFSDISALHAFSLRTGVASLHAPMTKHLTLHGAEDPCSRYLIKILTSNDPIVYKTEANHLNTVGNAKGILVGGNFAVLNGLAATPFDILSVNGETDAILFLEDIAEPIYKVDRMLTRLYLAGTLSRLKALIVGQFTEYSADRNFSSMEEMIRTRLDQWHLHSLPVAFGFPVGHCDNNLPLIEGAMADLHISDNEVTLVQEKTGI